MFIQGHVYRRRDLHDQYGGQRQGGISTPSRYPFVMLFTGESGEQHGYADGWSADGLFLYTGEGQQGDMAFIRGNPAGKILSFLSEKHGMRFTRSQICLAVGIATSGGNTTDAFSTLGYPLKAGQLDVGHVR